MKPIVRFAIYFLIPASTFCSCKKETTVSSSVPMVPIPPNRDSVPVTPGQLNSLGQLSVWRINTAAAAAGKKVLFAGGVAMNWDGDITGIFSRVDIYDIVSERWSTAELSEARYQIAAASAGNKIVFAGGQTETGPTAGVDIYDVVTNTWTRAELSEARSSISVASSGNKIFFAGGDDATLWSTPRIISKRVDIYDASLNSWSTATLSEPRPGIIAGAAGNKILFAGGLNSSTVDIYDTSTNVWSTAALSQTKTITAAASVGDTIFFVRSIGGGDLSLSSFSKQIDMYDASNGTWSVDSLNRYEFLSPDYPEDFAGAVTVGNVVVFVPSDVRSFIIYDATDHTWSLSPQARFFGAWETSFASTNNEMYIAGWEGVWRFQF